MKTCIKCGSHAFNLYAEEIDQGGLCDVHYWQGRAHRAEAQPQQEPVAIHQHRIPYCADWYDGIPDHHDGHGPYEVRTLYTTPPKRPWVGLTDEEISEIEDEYIVDYRIPAGSAWNFAQAIEAKLKELNT